MMVPCQWMEDIAVSKVAELLDLVYAAASQVNEVLPASQRLALVPETVLMGKGSKLDSLHLINLLVSLSSLVEDRTGLRLSLLEDERLFDEHGPLSSIQAMAEYLAGKA